MEYQQLSFEAIISCKPSKNVDSFYDHNPAINSCINLGLKLKILNSLNEVPDIKELRSILCSLFSETTSRPTLKDFIENCQSDWLIFMNSDVVINADFKGLIKELEKNNVDIASSSRYDFDSHFHNIEIIRLMKNNKDLKNFKNLCKKQSKRTLDIFIIRKSSIEIASVLQPKLNILIPGTVGFDNNLFGYMTENYISADVTQVIDIYHRNHENFRRIYKKNVLLENESLKTFVNNRNKERSLFSGYGCLSQSHFILQRDSKQKLLSKKNKYKFIKYYLESIRLKIENRLEKIIYAYNNFLYKFSKKLNIYVSDINIFGYVLLMPSIYKNSYRHSKKPYSLFISHILKKRYNR